MTKAQEHITELESSAPMAQLVPAPISKTTTLQTLREEGKAQKAITTTEKRAIELAESEINRHRSELR